MFLSDDRREVEVDKARVKDDMFGVRGVGRELARGGERENGECEWIWMWVVEAKEGFKERHRTSADRDSRIMADELATKMMHDLYKEHDCPKLDCSPRTAEFIKYASNSFLATKISFVNEMANMCNAWGIDFENVAEGMGLDSRISPLFLRAGAGFGGSCFPKDVKALAAASKSNKIESKMLNATLEVNDLQPLIIVQMAKERLGILKGKNVTVLGLAFKPDTDDIRDSISIELIKKLLAKKVTLTVYDPKAMKNTKSIFKEKIRYADSISHSLKNSQCAIIMVHWKQFEKINNNSIRVMKRKFIIDCRRVLLEKQLDSEYHAIGIGKI